MTRLGTKKKPAVIRVQSQERAEEVLDLCADYDWEIIVGVEEDKPEDITDVLKLLEPERFVTRVAPRVGRNDPCLCGSGAKYKKCCLRTASASATPLGQS
jgi:SWIM/SEC-C metal-binding protein